MALSCLYVDGCGHACFMMICAPTRPWVLDDDIFVAQRGGGGGRGGGGRGGVAVLWVQGTTSIAVRGILEVSHLVPHTLYHCRYTTTGSENIPIVDTKLNGFADHSCRRPPFCAVASPGRAPASCAKAGATLRPLHPHAFRARRRRRISAKCCPLSIFGAFFFATRAQRF